ncbi:AraC family transcriptional regulator [Achromobacter aegrifaciens]|nr:HTH-type transcriptional activator RhaS [Achromobacter aegrifaciens]
MSAGVHAGFCAGTTMLCGIANPPESGMDELRPVAVAESAHRVVHYGMAPVVPARAQTVMEGWSDLAELDPGMVLWRLDARDLQGARMRAAVRPGLHLALVVGGRVNVTLGEHRLTLGPGADGSVQGVMLSALRPDAFLRESCRGHIERTVMLTLQPQWLDRHLPGEEGLALRAFAQRHLALQTWKASDQAVAAAQQMLRPPVLPPPLWRLYQKSRALDIVVEALAHAHGTATEEAAPLSPRDRRRMAALREWIDQGGADALPLAEIAARACVSVNTLQRHFRAMWGTTVAQYLREGRLSRARLALERDGISVAQAACIAGYGSAANFATAFRRRFGVPPGQVRARR